MPKKVVFFFPSFASSEATAPLGLLAVATPLQRAGYSLIQLIDSTIAPNYKKRVLEEVKDALRLGISLVTGPMVRETVEIARGKGVGTGFSGDLSSLRKNSKICHSEPRSVFERGEESAFSLAFLRTADPSPANDAGSGRQIRLFLQPVRGLASLAASEANA